MIVARGFHIGGLLFGVPSLLALMAICWSLLHPSTPDHSAYLDVDTFGIAGLLANAAHGVGNLFNWFGRLVVWAERLLAMACAAALVWAVSVYFVGRGIARCSVTARVIGIVLSIPCLLFSVALLLLLPRGLLMVAPIVACTLSLYVVWVLGWRYA